MGSKVSKSEKTLQKIASATELQEYLSEKALGHSYFKHYTKRYKADSILSSHTLYLSNAQGWNDKQDSAQMTCDENVLNFGMCFSFSQSESVAMWMLYSGNDGVMIDFDKNTIRNVLNTTEIELGYWCEKEFIPVGKFENTDFTIVLSDVIYYGKADSEQFYYVRRSDEVCKEFEQSFVNAQRYTKKSSSWSYENECRIIVSIDKTKVIGIGCDIRKISDVRIIFDEKLVANLIDRTYDSPNCKESEQYHKSKLAGTINWDLCKDCQGRTKACLS